MALFRYVDDYFPGGRISLSIFYVLTVFLVAFLLPGHNAISATNAAALVFSILIPIDYRRTFLKFLRSAPIPHGAMCFCLAVLCFALGVDLTTGYRLFHSGTPSTAPIVVVVHELYLTGLFMVWIGRREVGDEIPPRPWLTGIGIVAGMSVLGQFINFD